MACERDEEKRGAWKAEVASVAPEQLKFLDESACCKLRLSTCHLAFTRVCGWAKRGMRCPGKVPGNTGRRQSMVAVLSLQGVVGSALQAGSLKAEDFARFLKEHVVEQLKAGDVLVFVATRRCQRDNARCHYSKQAKEAVEAEKSRRFVPVGARLLFLPAYSPDFSPIELVWHQVKAGLRRECPRTLEALQDRVTAGFEQVSPETARSYFAHCGYQALQT